MPTKPTVATRATEQKDYLLEKGRRLRAAALASREQLSQVYAESLTVQIAGVLVEHGAYRLAPAVVAKVGRLVLSGGLFLARKQPLVLAVVVAGTIATIALNRRKNPQD